MKIIKLEAENFKKLKAIEIDPKGNTIVVSGRNGQGKTSVLDTIYSALAGGDASKKIKRPIREGEESATIKLDLGDLVITRKWTGNDKSYLTVENKEGAEYKSPQSILDALVGPLAFDPLAFAGLKPKEQVETLLEVVDIDIDLVELDEQRTEIFVRRTDVNREVKRLEGVLSGIDVPAGTSTMEVSASALIEEIDAASRVSQEKDSLTQDIVTLTDKIARQENELQELRKSIEQEKLQLDKWITEEVFLVTPNVEALKQKLKGVEETNALARKAREKVEVASKLSEEKSITANLTEAIAKLDKTKDDAIKNAKMPVEGLSFNEDGLLLNNVPFAQASSAEQLKVSVAMAMAINPRLRVIRITDGSLLDNDSMKIIEEMATDNDYQIWIEQVKNSSDGTGIYIEEGEIISK